MNSIQKSIFTVCLDKPVPRVSEDVYRNHVAGQMLHGGGSQLNSGNRWFDKTLQVSEDRQGHDSQTYPSLVHCDLGLPAPPWAWHPSLPIVNQVRSHQAGRCYNYQAVSLSLLDLHTAGLEAIVTPSTALQHIRESLELGSGRAD